MVLPGPDGEALCVVCGWSGDSVDVEQTVIDHPDRPSETVRHCPECGTPLDRI